MHGIGGLTVAALVGALLLPQGAAAPAAAADDPANDLAQRYAPVVRLVAQTQPCGHGEPYQPTDVNVVLGNPDVALRGPWTTSSVVKVAPTAADLSKGLFGYHLDFPGDALSPGCDYEEWSRRITATSAPRVYAHIATEASHPGQLALQYWFFYPFNDFNDKHEGDWEMIQLNFSAATPAAALAVHPSDVGYSQHEGAERARWGDEKLELVDGTHAVVYPAIGSHANYYSANLYLGRSGAQGVGCDDSTGTSRELRPEVSLIPQDQSAYLREFPWLGYDGHWGEQHAGFYNGPTGPNTKDRWNAPFTWVDEHWRDKSFVVPAAHAIGRTATSFFCGAVAAGSSALTALVGNPSTVLLVLAGLALLLLWLSSRTEWNVSAPFSVRRRRPWGSLITSALRLYGGNVRLFVGIGLLFVPLGVLIAGLQYVAFRIGGLSELAGSAGSSNAAVAGPALIFGSLVTVIGLSIVQAATAIAVARLEAGEPITARQAYRLMGHRLRPLLGWLAPAVVIVALLGATLVGGLIAVWLTINWSLLAQVVVLENGATGRPLRRSARLVRGHWWRAASITVLVTGLGILMGPLIGTFLLFITSASFDFINLVSAVVDVVLLPFVAITTTYLYYDLWVREQLEPRATATPPQVLPAEF